MTIFEKIRIRTRLRDKETFRFVFTHGLVNEDVLTNGRSLKSYTVSYSNDGENWTVAKQGTVSDIKSSIICKTGCHNNIITPH